ncbi:hypothetical protein OAL67_01300, partial [bacterium]|nr:hypothetical protein [bacterium]
MRIVDFKKVRKDLITTIDNYLKKKHEKKFHGEEIFREILRNILAWDKHFTKVSKKVKKSKSAVHLESIFKKPTIKHMYGSTILYSLAFFGSFFIFKNKYNSALSLNPGLFITFCTGLLIVFLYYTFLKKGIETYKLWLGVLVLFLILASVNVIYDLVPVHIYGDKMGVVSTIYGEGSMPLSHSLAQGSIMRWIYALIWIQPVLKPFLSNIDFVTITSVIFLGGCAFGLIKKYKDPLFVILPILSPLWIMFMSGYQEYYPHISGFYLFILLLLFHPHLKGEDQATF